MHIFKFIVPGLSLQKWFVRSDYECNIVGTKTPHEQKCFQLEDHVGCLSW